MIKFLHERVCSVFVIHYPLSSNILTFICIVSVQNHLFDVSQTTHCIELIVILEMNLPLRPNVNVQPVVLTSHSVINIIITADRI